MKTSWDSLELVVELFYLPCIKSMPMYLSMQVLCKKLKPVVCAPRGEELKTGQPDLSKVFQIKDNIHPRETSSGRMKAQSTLS